MELLVNYEKTPPPRPKRVPPKRESVEYPFEKIAIGEAARFPRAARTVRNRLYIYMKTHRGQRFTIRAITPAMCRVWRVK